MYTNIYTCVMESTQVWDISGYWISWTHCSKLCVCVSCVGWCRMYNSTSTALYILLEQQVDTSYLYVHQLSHTPADFTRGSGVRGGKLNMRHVHVIHIATGRLRESSNQTTPHYIVSSVALFKSRPSVPQKHLLLNSMWWRRAMNVYREYIKRKRRDPSV